MRMATFPPLHTHARARSPLATSAGPLGHAACAGGVGRLGRRRIVRCGLAAAARHCAHVDSRRPRKRQLGQRQQRGGRAAVAPRAPAVDRVVRNRKAARARGGCRAGRRRGRRRCARQEAATLQAGPPGTL
eukprot:12958-Chlamydomonas_euryale.AAC.1